MTTIKALQNFGFQGEHVAAGTTLTVDPDDFGGTYQDFIAAGLFEEVPAPAPAKAKTSKQAAVTVQEPNGVTETIHPGSEVKAPAG
jgi:hypothetical protein